MCAYAIFWKPVGCPLKNFCIFRTLGVLAAELHTSAIIANSMQLFRSSRLLLVMREHINNWILSIVTWSGRRHPATNELRIMSNQGWVCVSKLKYDFHLSAVGDSCETTTIWKHHKVLFGQSFNVYIRRMTRILCDKFENADTCI